MITEDVSDTTRATLVALSGDHLSLPWSLSIALVLSLVFLVPLVSSVLRAVEASRALTAARTLLARAARPVDVPTEIVIGTIGALAIERAAMPEDERPEDDAVVSVRLFESGSQLPLGTQPRWREAARIVRVVPFTITTDRGEVVRVEPPADVTLRAPLSRTEPIAPDRRERVALALAGTRVTVIGRWRDGAVAAGPYRGGASACTMVGAPAMIVAVDPIDVRPRALRTFHTAIAALLAGFFAVLQTFLALGLYAHIGVGVVTLGRIVDVPPVAFGGSRLIRVVVDPTTPVVGGREFSAEISEDDLARIRPGDITSCVVEPGGAAYLGTDSGLATTHVVAVLIGPMLVLLLALWIVRGVERSARLWWEQALVDES